jgi:4-hydroxy-tetrahydrodipicolinate synthase
MFHGSIVALVTPMQADGVVDIDSLRHLIEWHITQGTDAIGVLGTTGEAPTLDETERKIIIQQSVEQARGRVPIIAGTGTYATQSTIHLTREAMIAGADACLLITPYCNKPTQEGLYQHFKAVAQAVPIPQILYNVPARTACDLKPTTVARLATFPNIIGIKEATGDTARVQEILNLTEGHSLDLYSGDDGTCLDFILAGGQGVISITSNIAPQLMHHLCEAALTGAVAEAKAIDQQLANLHQQMCIETNPIPVKWALQQMGMIPMGIRLPLTPLSESCHPPLIEAMKQVGIQLPSLSTT